MAAPPIIERHLHHFHRRSPIKESVRVATTANITIATALNNGDTLDGVTLATDDRVLVKDQTAPAENGIYLVAASPARAYDLSTDDPAFGFLVFVREGTAGAQTLWRNTNTSTPTIGTTALAFAQIGSLALASSTPVADGGAGGAGSATDAAKGDHQHPGDTVGVVWVMDGGGSALTTGVKGELQVPFACVITGWSILLDASGSIVIDVWKDTEANYPPVVGDSITAAAKPTVSGATKASSSTLTGWTTTVAAGDTFRFNIDSVATATRATLTLSARRS